MNGCIYRTEHDVCKKYTTDKATSFCVGRNCLDRKQSNSDRIRSMPDEELARFMWNRDIDIVEKASKAAGFTYTVDMEKCFENVLNWLKQESEGE